MSGGKVGKRLCDFRLTDLANAKGISKRAVSRDIRDGKLDPNDVLSVCRWLREPRYNKNKGRPLYWLHRKKGG